MFNKVFAGKKVLITGNTGFKGAWLTIWLKQLGALVTGISKDIPTQPSLFGELLLAKKIDHHFADINDLAAMKSLVDKVQPDFLFHLAAQPIVSTSYADPLETLHTNIIGTANILESLKTVKHRCCAVMITSDKCYDNVEWLWGYRESDALGGKDPYSASKGGAELVIKTYYHSYFNKPDSMIRLASVRAGNVIGGGDWATSRIVPDCVRAWASDLPVAVRSPKSTRPWQHVLEPLSGYLRVAQQLSLEHTTAAIAGEAFNFGPSADQNYTVLELLEAISQFWTRERKGDIFEIYKQQEFHEAGLLKLNCDKALAMLHWKPTLDFMQTAAFTGNWYNEYYNRANSDMYAFTEMQINTYSAIAKEKMISWTE